MKKSKSMFYSPSAEARELFVYTNSNEAVYVQFIAPIVKNLSRKYKKGIFDREKAAAAFYHAMNHANKLYIGDFGYSFDVTARYTAAIDMVDYYMENIEKDDLT